MDVSYQNVPVYKLCHLALVISPAAVYSFVLL